MKAPLALTAFLSLAALGCSPHPGEAASPSTQPASKPVAADVSGEWSGDAAIVVNWVKQRTLPVRINIAADGQVIGTVGDAALVNARLQSGRGAVQRSLGWGRDYRIHGELTGDILKAEQVRRDAVDIVFDRADGTLTGGVTSSGSEFGGRETMKLAAGNMVLKRTGNSAGAAAGGNTPAPKSP